MVTATKSNRTQRRNAALKNLRGDALQATLQKLTRNGRITREQLRLLYSEIRAAHGSPDCMPVDHAAAVVRDIHGNPTQMRMNQMVLRGTARLLLVEAGNTDVTPVLAVDRGRLICMVLTVHDYHLLD